MNMNFLSEPHRTRYFNFISSRPERIVKKEKGYHIHHILPKSMGGSDNNENLIKLTIREHYVAHLILWKGVGNKMSLAFKRMIFSKLYNFAITSRQYEQLRKSIKYSKEHRRKIGDANFGKKRSEVTRKRMSQSQIGKRHSETTKIKMSESQRKRAIEKPATDETRKKIKQFTSRKIIFKRKNS